MQRILVVLTMILGVLASIAVSSPAGAATQCSYATSKVVKKQYASNIHNYLWLYYSSSNRCIYGAIGDTAGRTLPKGAKLWLDISQDGGRTWESRVGQRQLGAAAPSGAGLITNPYYDGNRVGRACTQVYSGPVSCTGWF
jgi:hypothetical protein